MSRRTQADYQLVTPQHPGYRAFMNQFRRGRKPLHLKSLPYEEQIRQALIARGYVLGDQRIVRIQHRHATSYREFDGLILEGGQPRVLLEMKRHWEGDREARFQRGCRQLKKVLPGLRCNYPGLSGAVIILDYLQTDGAFPELDLGAVKQGMKIRQYILAPHHLCP